jgi:hypothetical protein
MATTTNPQVAGVAETTRFRDVPIVPYTTSIVNADALFITTAGDLVSTTQAGVTTTVAVSVGVYNTPVYRIESTSTCVAYARYKTFALGSSTNPTTIYTPVRVLQGQSFSNISGSPVNATVNGALVKTLPDAAVCEVSINFTETIASGGLDCFLYISGDAVSSGNVVLEYDIASAVPSGTPAANANKRFAVNLTTQHQLVRYQIPASINHPQADYTLRLRRVGTDGADTYTGAVSLHRVEYVTTPAIVEASITTLSGLTPTVFNTPFDGQAVLRQYALYNPIVSSATAVYIAEPVTIASVQQSRLAKMAKGTYTELQNVQLGTATHDSILGHRDCSVQVTSDGTVLAHGESHHVPFTGTRYPSENIVAGSVITVPTGLNLESSYRRFFRNPHDGSIWLAARGNSYNGYLGIFNGTATSTTQQQIGGSFSQFLGNYGLDLAFASADIVYCLLEPFRAVSGAPSGYPRQNINLIVSTDRGVTWRTMSGKLMSVSTPAAWIGNDDDCAFPTHYTGSSGGNGAGTCVSGKVGIGADGQPIVVASWKHPADTLRSTWFAKYDQTAKRWVRRRLQANDGVNHAGNPSLMYHNGKIIVCAGTTDDHDLTNAEITPANNQLNLYVTTDSGVFWRKYPITHAVGGYGGAYFDPECIRHDNILRMAPRRESVPTESKIWELPVPA